MGISSNMEKLAQDKSRMCGNCKDLYNFVTDFRSTDFDYKSPERWPEKYPNCGGSEQSPIAISRRKAIPLNLPPLIFALYDEFFDELVTIRNSGHTGFYKTDFQVKGKTNPFPLIVEFKVPTTIYGVKPYVTGGLLRDCYDAEAVHFHWGSPRARARSTCSMDAALIWKCT